MFCRVVKRRPHSSSVSTVFSCGTLSRRAGIKSVRGGATELQPGAGERISCAPWRPDRGVLSVRRRVALWRGNHNLNVDAAPRSVFMDNVTWAERSKTSNLYWPSALPHLTTMCVHAEPAASAPLNLFWLLVPLRVRWESSLQSARLPVLWQFSEPTLHLMLHYWRLSAYVIGASESEDWFWTCVKGWMPTWRGNWQEKCYKL